MSHQTEMHLANIARHSDVVLIHISDPIEQQLPPRGQYPVSDGRRVVQLNTSDRQAVERYRQRAEALRQHLQKLCRLHHMLYLPVSTRDDVLAALQTGLGLRSRLGTQNRSTRQPAAGKRT
jgi:uncharacterized protein (DUF58 family)